MQKSVQNGSVGRAGAIAPAAFYAKLPLSEEDASGLPWATRLCARALLESGCPVVHGDVEETRKLLRAVGQNASMFFYYLSVLGLARILENPKVGRAHFPLLKLVVEKSLQAEKLIEEKAREDGAETRGKRWPGWLVCHSLSTLGWMAESFAFNPRKEDYPELCARLIHASINEATEEKNARVVELLSSEALAENMRIFQELAHPKKRARQT